MLIFNLQIVQVHLKYKFNFGLSNFKDKQPSTTTYLCIYWST